MVDSVIICTSNRPKNYVDKTISSIKETLPIHLFVTGTDLSYLNNQKTNPQITITSTPITSDKTLVRQFTTYQTCLKDGYMGNEGIFIIEDDVKFSVGWKKRTNEIITELNSKYPNNFALSLFTSQNICKDNDLPPCHYIEMDAERFNGTQAMYYPNSVRLQILSYFETIPEEKVVNFDSMARDYMVINKIHIFIAIPCLVEHTGRISSWAKSTYYHPVAIIFNDSVL